MSIRASDIFHMLNNAGVAYVVIGGVAVNLHGHTRFTKDLLPKTWICLLALVMTT